MAIYEYCIMLLLKSPGNFIHLHLRVIRTSDNWLNIWEEFPHTQYIFLLMIIYKNSYSLTKKNKLQYWFLFRYIENNTLFRDGNRHFFMPSNHNYILSYLKRCISCWYWVQVLLRRTLHSYKIFGTNLRPSCDFFHSKKFTTICPNPTLTLFQVSVWFTWLTWFRGL